MTDYEKEFKKEYKTAFLCGDDHKRKDTPAYCEHLEFMLAERDAKLAAIREALPSDEKLINEIWGGNKTSPFHKPDKRIQANAYEKGVREIRDYIQNILDK